MKFLYGLAPEKLPPVIYPYLFLKNVLSGKGRESLSLLTIQFGILPFLSFLLTISQPYGAKV